MTTSPSRLRRLGAGTAAALALSGLAALATSAPAQAAPDRPGRGADRPAPVLGEQRASAVPGQYIVVLEDRADTAAAADAAPYRTRASTRNPTTEIGRLAPRGLTVSC